MTLAETIATLRASGLLDRATHISTGDVTVTLEPYRPEPEELSRERLTELRKVADEEEAEAYRQVLYAANGG